MSAGRQNIKDKKPDLEEKNPQSAIRNPQYRLGCDIGGTFTDFVLVNGDTGDFQINKCLTTTGDTSDEVQQGILDLL